MIEQGVTDKSIKGNNKFLNMVFKYLDDEFQVSSLNQLRVVSKCIWFIRRMRVVQRLM